MSDTPDRKPPTPSSSGEKFWLDNPGNVKLLVYALFVFCAFWLIAPILFPYKPHSYFGMDSIYGLYAVAGFVACVVVIVGAMALRKIVKRDEDYYDR